eukprot:GHVN01032160.1.p1 GENE.GHVN01032160.1~~GHVN01032160.1.p1  ORF type:complete len:357 (+),score=33.47 GHVN01032160.1:184-1254(+)
MFGQQQVANANPNKSHELANLPSDSVSCLTWLQPPIGQQQFLGCSSWDGSVRVWEIQARGSNMFGSGAQSINSALKGGYEHGAPVLGCAIGKDGAFFGGGCDGKLKMHNMVTNQTQEVGRHDAPISKVFFDGDVVTTGSWDKSIRFWDLRQQQPVAALPLEAKVWAMDVRWPIVVVAIGKKVQVYDMTNRTQTPFKTIDSLLAQQPRTTKIFPDQKGIGLGSIEGRVGIHYFAESKEQKNFAFKAHRVDVSKREPIRIFPVNGIDFHNPVGTFATCGADGVIVFWDKDNKSKLFTMEKCPAPVVDVKYDPSGTMLAYALSYDWHKGVSGYQPGQSPIKVFVHPLANEMKNKKVVNR